MRMYNDYDGRKKRNHGTGCKFFQRILYKVVHGYLGRFVGVILEGNKFIKIYLSTDMRKKVIDFHISVDFFLDKLV